MAVLCLNPEQITAHERVEKLKNELATAVILQTMADWDSWNATEGDKELLAIRIRDVVKKVMGI